MGLEIVNNVEAIPDGSLDVVYSTMALEHVVNPYGILRSLHAKLRQGGKIIIHVPAEDSNSEYVVNDENNHLYSWNQLTLGNLVKNAGFFIDETRLIESEWPTHYSELYDQLGEKTFSVLEYIYGRIRNHKSVIVVGIKTR